MEVQSYPSTETVLEDIQKEAGPAAAEPTKQEAKVEEPAPPSWQEDEYEIDGKKIKEPREMILKRAQLGYRYAQRAHELNQKEESFKEREARFKEIEEANKKLARWQEYNEFAEKNPEWWQTVEQAWQNRANVQQSSQDPINPIVATLQQELAEVKKQLGEFHASTEQQKQALQTAAEDKAFDEEISSVATKFGVDLSATDEQGRSLEWQVLEHMKSLGMDGSKPGHFTAAFKDYHFDNFVSRSKEQALEQHAKGKAEAEKAGILDVSRTPKGKTSFNGSPSNYSWNELADMALADLRSGKV